MHDLGFFKINEPNNSIIFNYYDLFIKKDEYNQNIYNSYKKLMTMNEDVGVNVLKDAHVFGEWGIILNEEKNIPKLKNFGWFPDAYKHLAKNNSEYFTYEGDDLTFIADCNFEHVNASCAMLSFPGALTYGHWIVDIIFRYEFLNLLRLNHKIDKFILPASVGKWANVFKEYLNLDDANTLTISNSSFINIKELYVPTVASFLPGSTLPVKVARNIFSSFKSYLMSLPSNIVPLECSVVMLMHTRQTSGAERDIDLSIIENYVKGINGFVIDPLDYSLSDLIQLLSKCKVIIGQDSSALHNNAFIGADLIVIESIPRKNMLHVSIQQSINKKIFFIDSVKKENSYVVNVEKIKAAMDSYEY
jgi:hypothetical protein